MSGKVVNPGTMVQKIKRRTRKRCNTKEKINIVLERLKGEASNTEVVGLRKENDQLKALVAELPLKNRVLKNLDWLGERIPRGIMR